MVAGLWCFDLQVAGGGSASWRHHLHLSRRRRLSPHLGDWLVYFTLRGFVLSKLPPLVMLLFKKHNCSVCFSTEWMWVCVRFPGMVRIWLELALLLAWLLFS
jgi:hypothetical protein